MFTLRVFFLQLQIQLVPLFVFQPLCFTLYRGICVSLALPPNPALLKVPTGSEKTTQGSRVTSAAALLRQHSTTGSHSSTLWWVQDAAVSTTGNKVLQEHGVTVLSNNSVVGQLPTPARSPIQEAVGKFKPHPI